MISVSPLELILKVITTWDPCGGDTRLSSTMLHQETCTISINSFRYSPYSLLKASLAWMPMLAVPLARLVSGEDRFSEVDASRGRSLGWALLRCGKLTRPPL